MANALKLTLAQLNPVVGDIEGNAAKVRMARDASPDSDLIIFPELFLCGYPPEDLVFKPIFLRAVRAAVDALVAESKDHAPALLLSVPWREDHKTYSALLLVRGGHIVHQQFKHHLPNYGVFDEKRIFEAGPLPDPVPFKGHMLGLMVCEDFWFPDVAGNLKDKGAELLIIPNGSPFSLRNVNDRMDIAAARAQQTGLPLVYVNQVGGQDELVFDGASFVTDENGTHLYKAPAFEERVETLAYPFDFVMGPEDAPNEERIYRAVTLGLKDYVGKNGFPGVVLGLSGGIDSALTAAICVDALGADKVHCVMLPSAFTSQDSLDDAKACADALGCAYQVIPIAAAMAAFESTLPDLSGTAHENMQSRARGLILMALSNMSGDMVVSTGNKSELATGYATLYGDMNGGFNPVKDLYKTQIYALARWRNDQGAVIPERILTKAPTAELRPDQRDQDSLPPYDVLDGVLKCLIEWEMGFDATVKEGFAPETVRKVWALLDRAEYKRRQACPGVKVTGKAFGRDRRMPMTNGFIGVIEKK